MTALLIVVGVLVAVLVRLLLYPRWERARWPKAARFGPSAYVRLTPTVTITHVGMPPMPSTAWVHQIIKVEERGGEFWYLVRPALAFTGGEWRRERDIWPAFEARSRQAPLAQSPRPRFDLYERSRPELYGATGDRPRLEGLLAEIERGRDAAAG